jgi:hypothetical protein
MKIEASSGRAIRRVSAMVRFSTRVARTYAFGCQGNTAGAIDHAHTTAGRRLMGSGYGVFDPQPEGNGDHIVVICLVRDRSAYITVKHALTLKGEGT